MPQGVFPNGNSGQFPKGVISWNKGKHHSDGTKNKISRAKKGKPAPWMIERNQKFVGKLNPNYAGEDAGYLTPEHLIYKEYKKEHPNCEICSVPSEIIHHKDKNRYNNKKENLQSLCYSCHAKIHNKLANFGERLFRKGWKKPKKFEVVK